MTLENLKSIFAGQGCQTIYVKKLAPNDNSKNQVYLGGSFDILNIFPISSIKADSSGNWNRDRFKVSLNFAWIGEDRNIYPAPHTQLILYPKYPEVRLSGFLNHCEKPPSTLMTQRLAGRLLFLSVSSSGQIIGYVTAPDSSLAREFNTLHTTSIHGVFTTISISIVTDHKQKLLHELRRIHALGWIDSKRLGSSHQVLPCNSSNCGGYTLEAELGITPNGYSEPDYLGWEIKQFGVKSFSRTTSAVITLMTPEPKGGYYVSAGIDAFMRTYGYADMKGRVDRINFGGIHKVGCVNNRTGLRLELLGFDQDAGKIRHTDGKIALIDARGNEAAAWPFSSLLEHWTKKHNQACYIPSLSRITPIRQYSYGHMLLLGSGTDFLLFLREMSVGHIYYDPGIKMESASTKPHVKKRSQFRVKSVYLTNLYRESEQLDLLENTR